MDLLLQESCICPFRNKLFHLLKLILTSSLESRRVMENESLVTLEDHFMIDIMESALQEVGWAETELQQLSHLP